jgi:hypothetical protein
MAKLLPDDFREFLKLCNRKRVKYLLIGGYAVSHYGYPRATADMDIWVESSAANASRLVTVLKEFGYGVKALAEDLFLKPDQVIRMGVPPLRLEILTTISGVKFPTCYSARTRVRLDGILVDLISLGDLRKNKRASGRLKDRDDLAHLPG